MCDEIWFGAGNSAKLIPVRKEAIKDLKFKQKNWLEEETHMWHNQIGNELKFLCMLSCPWTPWSGVIRGTRGLFPPSTTRHGGIPYVHSRNKDRLTQARGGLTSLNWCGPPLRKKITVGHNVVFISTGPGSNPSTIAARVFPIFARRRFPLPDVPGGPLGKWFRLRWYDCQGMVARSNVVEEWLARHSRSYQGFA